MRRGFQVSVILCFVTCFGFGFAHGLPVESDTVGVVNEPVENGVCKGGFTDHIMPGVNGQLAGDPAS